MTTVKEIRRALDQPGLQRLWEVGRTKLEQRGLDWRGTVSLGELTTEERGAIGRLMGLGSPLRPPARVSLAKLETALLQSRLEIRLQYAIESILGVHLRDLRRERELSSQQWDAIWADVEGHPAVTAHAKLSRWLGRIRRSGTLKRVGGTSPQALLTQTLDLVGGFPKDGQLLTRVASEATNNPHALDPGQPLGTLCLSALAHLAGESFPSTSIQRRALWAQYGIIADELAATVLALNLSPRTDPGDAWSAVAEQMMVLAKEGEPVSLTLSQLLRQPALRFHLEGEVVLVCENPSVMSAARNLGPAARPMVCVFGRFNTAAARLLQYLADGGAELRYHGDFDWGGIRIANEVMQRFGAKPWRYSSEDYLVAIGCNRGAPTLVGKRCEAIWDAQLADLIEQRELAVHEESVLDVLSKDLRANPRSEDELSVSRTVPLGSRR